MEIFLNIGRIMAIENLKKVLDFSTFNFFNFFFFGYIYIASQKTSL
jgi:hypothetical protein